MSKIYFSRPISRTMSADHPVGDPTGGAAYGEKNDPISAVLSIATMAGTYATAGTFAAMTIAQGITFAGAALSLVGNVTGNKTLSKIGMVAGIAGGLGQLAGIQGPTLGQTFGGSAPVSSSGGTAAGAMSSKSGSLSQSQASGNLAAGGDLSDEIAAQTKITQQNMAARGGNVSGTSAQPYVNTPTSGSMTNSGSSYTGPITPAGADLANYAGPTVSTADPGFFSKAWETTKDLASGLNPITNPYGAMAVGQIAQPIADYLSGKTDAEIDALEAQTGYADARSVQMQEEIAKEKRRRENLNAGYSQVNAGINVNPAVLGQAQAGGLISGAMQPAA
jgi:hypothetical protein